MIQVKQGKNIVRVRRYRYHTKEWRKRFADRYGRYWCYMVNKHGIEAPVNQRKRTALKRLQIAISRENEKFRIEHPNFG